ncbi:MAG: sulfur oxidation c-type cytochrome SoxX [Meiothermus sp.]|uniref:sulfur oxidation c-type cytochrome SoxX n=1 Tax=Meiothermus sp. TaxID=1955249 RepID=UPI0025F569D6|nr:sulfur oxidation c-type cytochrome SoxX [Meiothermus sp.]MCS7067857.1 sulfur oxidation c-type cytochrome SoxX [Meiothermus sp.]MCX7600578.1 sulfur oxidation c-type cytochrome SoxX [Meiothermus sp.]MDW8424753.1 sulfur oxidation c-type cytochrome SoxX [Meiothermus sp.]
MRRLYLPTLLLMLLGLASGQTGQSYINAELQRLIQAGGQSYANTLLRQAPDQALCSIHRNKLPAEVLGPFIEEQRKSIKYPADGKLMGDWKQGEPIFNTLARGNCFSCHVGSPLNIGGNVGPSLEKYGQRGTSEAMQKYTYEVIYNTWAYFPCTVMYRFGHGGLLKPEEIAHVVAYLLDPASDFNTKPALKR